MSFHNTYYIPLSSDLANLLRHFYRKGLSDGAESGDEWAVREITERDDLSNKFKFLSEFQGKIINFNVMFELVQSEFKHVNPKVIHYWFSNISSGYNVKYGICFLCDEYYRAGLRDGLISGRKTVEAFLVDYRKGYAAINEKHASLNEFLKEVKTIALNLSIIRDDISLKMNSTVKFLAFAVKNRVDYCYLIKNETE